MINCENSDHSTLLVLKGRVLEIDTIITLIHDLSKLGEIEPEE